MVDKKEQLFTMLQENENPQITETSRAEWTPQIWRGFPIPLDGLVVCDSVTWVQKISHMYVIPHKQTTAN